MDFLDGFKPHMHSISPLPSDDFMKKDRVIAHPEDYQKLAESGVVKMLVDAGVSVHQDSFAIKGKLITTGNLAKTIMDMEKDGK